MLPTGPNAASAFFLITDSQKSAEDTEGNRGHKGKSDGD
jgi:hypothetical protein